MPPRIRNTRNAARAASSSSSSSSSSLPAAAASSSSSPSNISFRDSACYVFGMAGYENSLKTRAVMEAFVDTGTTIAGEPFRATELHSAENLCMTRCLAGVRKNCGATPYYTKEKKTIPIIVYGEFTKVKGDDRKVAPPTTPDHVWIEMNGRIYETYPGKGLMSEEATSESKTRPQAIRHIAPKKYNVGRTESILTQAQHANINDPKLEEHDSSSSSEE